jgi:transposase
MPKGRAISLDLRNAIVQSSLAKNSPTDIAFDLGVSITTVRRIIRLYELVGLIKPPPQRKRGRKPAMKPEDLEVRALFPFIDLQLLTDKLLKFLRDLINSLAYDRYLDEVQKYMADGRGVNVSVTTISRALAGLNITNKKVRLTLLLYNCIDRRTYHGL